MKDIHIGVDITSENLDTILNEEIAKVDPKWSEEVKASRSAIVQRTETALRSPESEEKIRDVVRDQVANHVKEEVDQIVYLLEGWGDGVFFTVEGLFDTPDGEKSLPTLAPGYQSREEAVRWAESHRWETIASDLGLRLSFHPDHRPEATWTLVGYQLRVHDEATSEEIAVVSPVRFTRTPAETLKVGVRRVQMDARTSNGKLGGVRHEIASVVSLADEALKRADDYAARGLFGLRVAVVNAFSDGDTPEDGSLTAKSFRRLDVKGYTSIVKDRLVDTALEVPALITALKEHATEQATSKEKAWKTSVSEAIQSASEKAEAQDRKFKDALANFTENHHQTPMGKTEADPKKSITITRKHLLDFLEGATETSRYLQNDNERAEFLNDIRASLVEAMMSAPFATRNPDATITFEGFNTVRGVAEWFLNRLDAPLWELDYIIHGVDGRALPVRKGSHSSAVAAYKRYKVDHYMDGDLIAGFVIRRSSTEQAPEEYLFTVESDLND